MISVKSIRTNMTSGNYLIFLIFGMALLFKLLEFEQLDLLVRVQQGYALQSQLPHKVV